MIRKIASITTFITWVIITLQIIFFEKIPVEITQYVDDIYPSQPYEGYFGIIALITIMTSCYLIYKNSKYAIHSFVLTIIFVYLPFFIIPGIDVASNISMTLSELGDISYGIAVGALLLERQKKTSK
jgi:amino acid permease